MILVINLHCNNVFSFAVMAFGTKCLRKLLLVVLIVTMLIIEIRSQAANVTKPTTAAGGGGGGAVKSTTKKSAGHSLHSMEYTILALLIPLWFIKSMVLRFDWQKL